MAPTVARMPFIHLCRLLIIDARYPTAGLTCMPIRYDDQCFSVDDCVRLPQTPGALCEPLCSSRRRWR